MGKFGLVGIFSLFPRETNNQIIPRVDFHYHYNTAKEEISRWEKLRSQLPGWHPKRYPYRSKIGRYTKESAQQFYNVLTEFQPDLVIGEVWIYRYIPLVKRFGCRFILDEHNVHGIWLKELYAAYAAMEKRRLTIRQKLELAQTQPIEQHLIRQAAQVWVCSSADEQQLKNLYAPVPHVQVIPNGVDIASYNCIHSGKCSLPEKLKSHGQNVLYLGQFSYAINAEAVELLIQKIYPRLRQIYPDCRLLLVGRNPNQHMLAAAQADTGIIVTGQVSDIRPYLAAASVMAVPLQHGGGTRLKILEAFASSCPVVSTTKGAEGLNITDGEHLLIRDEIDAMVEGISQLWSNQILRTKLTDSAYRLVKANYSWQAVGRKIESAIYELF
ncbi:MAG: glycosyltransferase family 4 protein [Cyanobacteria bacterium P01_B01_bin.77]